MILKEKLNPYKRPLGEAFRALFREIPDRIKWDLNPESRRSAAKFAALKNSHLGEKAVMFFNGPSLLKTNFDLLRNVYTFGINKVNLLTEMVGFTPSVVVAFDELINVQNQDFFRNSDGLPKILNYKSLSHIAKTGDDFIYMYYVADPSFTYDPSLSLSSRGSTPYIAFQIAYYMGFQEIAIVGADHNFPVKRGLTQSVNEKEDSLHFHKDYHKKGETNFQSPDKLNLDLVFRDVLLAYEAKGRKIYNATEGGNLEIFERMTLPDFLDKNRSA